MSPPPPRAIESLAGCVRLVYFVSAKGPKTVGGLYSFNLAGGPVDVLVYDPVDKVVTVLVGSGQKGNDGKKLTVFDRTESTLYVKPVIFVTDAATGNVKLITELSGKTQLLKHLSILYEIIAASE